MPDLFSSSEHWQHTFVIDLKIPNFQHDDQPKCKCPEIAAVSKHLSSVHNDTMLYVDTVTNNILDMVHVSDKLPSRRRRSLLPFVGKIASGLFGLSTSSDVQKIANNLNALHKNNDKLDASFKHQIDIMSSFMATSNERFNNAITGLKNNHDMIVQMENSFESFSDNFEEKQSWLFAKVIDQSYNYNFIRNNYQNLYLGFITLLQGKLSPLLISQSDMSKALRLVKYTLLANNPSFKLLHQKPSFYYNHADFSLHKSNHAILITVKFPISSLAQPFKLYEIIHYPLPINNTVTHSTMIEDLPAYIASNEQHYISLPRNIFSECDKSKHFINCHINFPVIPITKPDCALSILTSNKTSVKNNCNFKFVPNALKPTFRQLNQTHFLAANNSHTTIHCGKQTHALEKCHFCLFQVPCNCTVTTDTVIIPQRNTGCHTNSGFTTLHPVNLIMLQHFFDEKAIADIQPNTTFPQPLNITIKPFHIYEHQFQNLIAKDKANNLNLDKMISAAKEDKIIYSDLAEPFLQDFTTDNETSFSAATALALISITFSVALAIAMLFMYKKHNKLITALLLANNVPTVTSSKLPSFHYTDQPAIATTTTQSPLAHFHEHFLEFNEYVICTLAILVFVYFIYKRIKPFSRPVLYLEISNGKHCVFCPILYLPTCARNCVATKSTLTPSVTIKLGLRSELMINWNELHIQVTNPSIQLNLPHSVKLNPINAYSVYRILNNENPYTLYLWVTHNQFCIPIEIGASQFPSAPMESNEAKPLLYPKISE